MLMDYHLHSLFSSDGKSSIEDICLEARRTGISHIAITDHHDIGNPQYEMANISNYVLDMDHCKSLFADLDVARGMEMDYRPQTWELMKRIPAEYGLDFALLSLHFIDGIDPYMPEYFEGRSQKAGYSLYLQKLIEMISATQGPWVLGHFTYVSKFARFSDSMMRYSDYADELDEALRLAVNKGYGLEVNASGLKNNAGLLPGSDVLRRFRELGGEIVTTGSDAHCAGDVGRWVARAQDAARDAGFRYLAAFKGLKPQFIKID